MRQRTTNLVRRLTPAQPGTAVGGGWTGDQTFAHGQHPQRTTRAATPIYGRAGALEVRLANSRDDVQSAQRLRYNVFYEEMSATPNITARMRRRDEDPFDAVCDHLLVVDRDPPKGPAHKKMPWAKGHKQQVAGTYRLLRQDVAEQHGFPFYTQSEYDIAPLIAAKGRGVTFMELGRSCVLKPYRTRRTVELLWHGLWTYIRQHNIDVMIGCASFEGTDPSAHATALSFLHHTALAPPEWAASAHTELYHPMDMLPADLIDTKAAMKLMPPLIKGYLRLGAYVGDGAIIDHEFGTTDVLIILPVARIEPRYFTHFGFPDELTSRIAARAGQ